MLSTLCLILFLISFPQLSVAQDGETVSTDESKVILPMYFELSSRFGKGSVGGNDELEAMDASEQSFGLALGYRFFQYLLFAISYESLSFAQTSEIDPSVGNISGSVTSPFAINVGFSVWDFTFKYTHFLFGNYKLEKKTSVGNEIEYGEISGSRIELLYKVWWNFHAGIFSQNLGFSEQFNSGMGLTSLTSDFEVSQTGLTISLIY